MKDIYLLAWIIQTSFTSKIISFSKIKYIFDPIRAPMWVTNQADHKLSCKINQKSQN